MTYSPMVCSLRVCLVTPYDLSYDGGVNRHVIALADALRARGHQVSVLGPASGDIPAGCDGLPGVVNVEANGATARVGLLVPKRAVMRHLLAGRFDVVHVHEPIIPGIAHYAALASSAPRVATFHTYAERESLAMRLARHALSGRLSRIQAGIAVSPAAAEFARRVFRGPLQVIPNGIASSDFSWRAADHAGVPGDAPGVRRPRREDGGSDALRVLFVGRFDEPRKGLRHLLAAAALVRGRGRAIELRIAGPGNPERFQGLGGPADVCFLGRLDDVELVAAYRDCDVFCAPSTHGESFGLVLIEAMACGRPVVASDIRGYRDASAGAALLVPPGNPEALATALVRVADDRLLRTKLVQRGTQRAGELTWHALAGDVSAVYRATAAGHGSRDVRIGTSGEPARRAMQAGDR